MLSSLIFASVLTGLNIYALIYRFKEAPAELILYDITFQVFVFVTIFYIYMVIVEIKETFFKSPNLDRFYDFCKNTLFKFLFCFQGYSFYVYLKVKFTSAMKFNGTFQEEFTLMYFQLILYILLMFSIYFFRYKLAILNFLNDLLVILIVTLVFYAISSIYISSKAKDWSSCVPNLAEYLIVFAMAFNSFQFYNLIVARRTGDVEPTPYLAI